MAGGAQLLLKSSGREITYSRLRATDAERRELPARMEVLTRVLENSTRKAELVIVISGPGFQCDSAKA